MEDVENYKLYVLSADGIDSDEYSWRNDLIQAIRQNHVFKSSFHPLDENEVTHTVRLVVEGDCNADNDITGSDDGEAGSFPICLVSPISWPAWMERMPSSYGMNLT